MTSPFSSADSAGFLVMNGSTLSSANGSSRRGSRSSNRSVRLQDQTEFVYHNSYSPLLVRSRDSDLDSIDIETLDEQHNGPGQVGNAGEIGVQKADILTHTWSRKALHVAYFGLFLLAFSASLAGQTTSILTPFATSEFSLHSLLATVQVVQGILYAVVKAPMAKLANTFGRLEAFMFALLLFVAGYLQMASSGGVGSYISAQIFVASGTTGLLVLQQIFVADTTDLLNRALFSALPDTPYLFTMWLGPSIANVVTEKFTWRVGYGVWTIVVPLCGAPLLLTLLRNQVRAKKLGLIPKYAWTGRPVSEHLIGIWKALDFVGILMFTIGCSLVLIPLTITSAVPSNWSNPLITATLLTGAGVLAYFVKWEVRLSSLAENQNGRASHPLPLLSLHILSNRTVRYGSILIFFYDVAFNIFQPYFFSFLMVSRPLTTDSAGRIVQTFSFASTIAALVIALVIKYSSRYKLWMIIGVPIYQVGILSMHFTRNEQTPTGLVVLSQIVAGIGGGVVSIPAQLGVQASCQSKADVASATALFLTVFSLGSAVGAAVSGAIWTSFLPRRLLTYVPESIVDQVPKIYANFQYARQEFPDLGSPERMAIVHAYRDVMAILIYTAVAATIPGVIAGLCMSEYKLDEITDEVGDLPVFARFGRKASVDSEVRNGSMADRNLDGDSMMTYDDDEVALGAGVGAGMAVRAEDVVVDTILGRRK
ncbi:major facilitator superfamily domain-containing protein [Lipomyces japonicus]|uniref:major facilitator superfamily domain-containing protein n=1 Tax=Lipomyces japonicus TaxID=56871 RepID=UPI0034D007A0